MLTVRARRGASHFAGAGVRYAAALLAVQQKQGNLMITHLGQSFMLRAFQKKSTIGIKTPATEIQLIVSRFMALLRELGLI